MKNAIAAFIVGFIFALGLTLSGMTLPQKVIGFLDLFGQWDPSLMFVMIGAIATHFVAYKLIRKKSRPLFSTDWHVPLKKEITPALVIGSFIFGIGWALGGFCPGPAITSVASFQSAPLLFVASMLVGMLLFRQVDRLLKIQK